MWKRNEFSSAPSHKVFPKTYTSICKVTQLRMTFSGGDGDDDWGNIKYLLAAIGLYLRVGPISMPYGGTSGRASCINNISAEGNNFPTNLAITQLRVWSCCCVAIVDNTDYGENMQNSTKYRCEWKQMPKRNHIASTGAGEKRELPKKKKKGKPEQLTRSIRGAFKWDKAAFLAASCMSSCVFACGCVGGACLSMCACPIRRQPAIVRSYVSIKPSNIHIPLFVSLPHATPPYPAPSSLSKSQHFSGA